MNQKQLQVVAVIVGCYIAAQIFSDITSLKIILLGGLVVDGGTLIYPFSFTLRDLLHKSAGVKVTRTVIVLAAALNLLMAGLFWGLPHCLSRLISPCGPQSRLRQRVGTGLTDRLGIHPCRSPGGVS
jgi:uncharacterized PurR-regulated membrane protein YhhQ (DUF165 family)